MAELREFRLPDVGEGLTEAEIVNWLVAVGDTVAVNDAIVEVETAKSVVELPTPFTGRVARLLVNPGDTVAVGSVLVAIEAADDEVAPAARPEPVLVGYGVAEAAPARRRLRPSGGTSALSAATADVPAGAAPIVEVQRPREPVAPGRVLAAPPVRALARRLGVDLARLAGPAPVSRDAVLAAADSATVAAPPTVGAARGSSVDRPRETRVPIRGIRKATAQAMVASAFTAPHATVWRDVDMTASIDLLARLRGRREWAGVRLSALTLVARALVLAVREHPALNATWDEAAGELVTKHYVNLGIAAATPRGLLVPHVADADALSTRELAGALADLVEAARQNRTAPGALTGGTITITNLGPLGLDGGTPILNPGESAILGVGAIRPTPWVVDGRIEVRQVGQLVLSFDHRVADGAEAAALLGAVADLLHDPTLALVS